MVNVVITGATGLIGKNLVNNLLYTKSNYNIIIIDKIDFNDEVILDKKIINANFIVHLAAICRDANQDYLYTHNLFLTNQLISSLKRTSSKAHIIFASSTHEKENTAYGKSKLDSRKLLHEWSNFNNTNFHGLIIPNTFGPFGKPFHNSVISTFCYQLTHNEACTVNGNNLLKFIYVDDLVNKFIQIIDNELLINQEEYFLIDQTHEIGIKDLYDTLLSFKTIYLEMGIIPSFKNRFELQLFNTYRSYIELKTYFPRKYVTHSDIRGSFIELIKIQSGGQISFSTTKPNITRGNHFHTRKIERFMVIKGDALIELRKVDNDERISFLLHGDNPSYVDMPIWYTHNIKNIGSDELLTIFWINEFYDQENPDTFLMEV
jgi:UDP-2-acetamido-2,6-beta-L-arabino-hexul-4-ose reductase